MGGDWYLRHMIGPAIKSLDKNKAQAVEYIFNRMCNRCVDPIEFFDEMRVLLDIKDRHGESTKPKLYELDTYSDPFNGGHAIVLAFDETEARVIASEIDDRFLENSSCDVVDTSKVGDVLYYMEC